MTRNKNLLYAFDEKPPIIDMILLAFQYMIPNIISLLFLALILQQTKISPLNASSILSITMIIMALISLLQAIKSRWIGSGTLLPPSIAPPYIPASILAIKTGGLSLVFGMTLIAGIMQIALSFVIKYIKKIIPAEISALVLLLIGFSLGSYSIHMYAGMHSPFSNTHKTILYFIVMYFPLALILILDQLCGATLKKYNIAIAVVISYGLIYLVGFTNSQHIHLIQQSTWLFLPHLFIGHYQFSGDLTIMFILAAIICVTKMIGTVPALEEIQVEQWQGPNFNRLARANFIDGLATLFAGILAPWA